MFRKYVKCKNGHEFDPKEHKICPHCPKLKTDPELPKGDQVKDTEVDLGSAKSVPGNAQFGKTIAEDLVAGPGQAHEVKTTRSQRGITPVQEIGGRKTRLLSEGMEPKSMPIFGWLVVLEGSRQYEVIRIDQEQIYIGSSPQCETVFDDEFVSREHASIRFRDGKFHIIDLESRNGTFVNDFAPEAAVDRVELHDGDEIHIGCVVMKFKCL